MIAKWNLHYVLLNTGEGGAVTARKSYCLHALLGRYPFWEDDVLTDHLADPAGDFLCSCVEVGLKDWGSVKN